MKLLTSVLIAFFSLIVFGSPVFADTVSTNFENPPYVLGSINGQDGWVALGSSGSGCATYDQAVSPSQSITGFGLQSFRVSDAITSGCFGDQAFMKPLINAVGEADSSSSTFSTGVLERHFEMKFNIASASILEQPGLHVSVSPDRGDGSRMSYLRFEDHVDGIHVFFVDVSDSGPVGTVASFNEQDIATIDRSAHAIRLTVDLLDGPANDVVKVWVDGVLKVTGTSWEDYYRYDPESTAEQSPRIIKSVIFRSSGQAFPADFGNGYLFDNISLLSSTDRPKGNVDLCKNDGWKLLNNPKFKNQGDCVSYMNHFSWVTGNISMSNPSQQLKFVAMDYGLNSAYDMGNVEYWNNDYPGLLHYSASVICSSVNTATRESRFMFQIPTGWPGLSGLYVVSYVKDGGTPGTNGDIYGHSATSNLAQAKSWCETGSGFAPSMYPIVSGNLVVHD